MKPRRLPGRDFPAYWLAASDAAAFAMVQSVLAVAVALRTRLADQVRIVARLPAADIALLFLTAAESGWGKAKAESIVSQIVDLRELDSERTGKACMIIGEALAQVPLSQWAPERHGNRADLLDALRARARQAHETMMPKQSEARKAEAEWLAAVEGRRRAEGRQA
ncbi:MAG TPA: hypothetical protein VIM12_13550 [Noviherbaspirillum sp.]|uniref:hypothetical protein n=1 Tax=Noviherbaspirillum sp. TaxID=1926288 RepID=UPI002F92A848